LTYLLDTVVLSETRKARPDGNAERWLKQASPSSLFVSVVTLYEVERGIAMVEPRQPAFARDLVTWLETMPRAFGERLLAIDSVVATRWARLAVMLGHMNADVAISATALVHGLTVATRNADDFLRAGVPVLNPFEPNPRVARSRL
jgi:predicted nucleic acid-binding protein